MIEFIKRLFGASETPKAPQTAKKPLLPQAELEEFKSWFDLQRKPAVELKPSAETEVDSGSSRLGGPAWIPAGDSWPLDRAGVPLEFLAQINCADCQGLANYPKSGLLQFFIGRDDLYGMNLDNLFDGSALVRLIDVAASGSLRQPPPLEEIDGIPFSDFTPFLGDEPRNSGIALISSVIEDRIDQSVKDMEQRIHALYLQYDISELENFIESDEVSRQPRHQTGGYPAFTQTDIRYQEGLAEYDHVLLRLTSDSILQWGDVGEAVFMIRSADLASGDFSRVAYSWDCY